MSSCRYNDNIESIEGGIGTTCHYASVVMMLEASGKSKNVMSLCWYSDNVRSTEGGLHSVERLHNAGALMRIEN